MNSQEFLVICRDVYSGQMPTPKLRSPKEHYEMAFWMLKSEMAECIKQRRHSEYWGLLQRRIRIGELICK